MRLTEVRRGTVTEFRVPEGSPHSGRLIATVERTAAGCEVRAAEGIMWRGSDLEHSTLSGQFQSEDEALAHVRSIANSDESSTS